MSNVIKRDIIMTTSKQTYRYKVEESILGNIKDEYSLSEHEYYCIYSFYVTYSMCGNQSFKKRNFTDYGWPENSIRYPNLKKVLNDILKFKESEVFQFTEKDDLKTQFEENNLLDVYKLNVDTERFVIGKTNEKNQYLKLFHRIRNGFAHGKFKLRLSSNNEKMVVIQDDNGNNVTARIVLRLSTILRFICAVDIKGLI